MEDRIDVHIEWQAAEHPELTASALALGLARILRPEVFRLCRQTAEALAAAREVVAPKPAPPPVNAVMEEIEYLKARLAELTTIAGQQASEVPETLAMPAVSADAPAGYFRPNASGPERCFPQFRTLHGTRRVAVEQLSAWAA